MDKIEIGVRLREYGLNKFPTLADFARALGIDPQNLNSYLSGRRRPGNKMKFRLKKIGCDASWLMTGKKKDNFQAAEEHLIALVQKYLNQGSLGVSHYMEHIHSLWGRFKSGEKTDQLYELIMKEQ